jgi:hypothetical protein
MELAGAGWVLGRMIAMLGGGDGSKRTAAGRRRESLQRQHYRNQ